MWSVHLSLVFTCLMSCVTSLDHVIHDDVTTLSRHPRYLVYPPRGAYKLVLGVAIPLPIPVKRQYLAWTTNFQFQYALPINITQLPPLRGSRSLRHIDRTMVYATLVDYMEGRGLEGRECLLRSICDAAAFPLQHDGLLGNLMQILLTPRMQKSSCSEYVESDYVEAQILGESGVDCSAAYPKCSKPVLELVSELHHL